ncbi:MAG: hypothetical protein ACK2TZ_08010, partial [Anaerolineales bacterium]
LKTTLIIIFTFLLLNPFYWKHPLGALEKGIKARFSLASDQQEDHLGQYDLEGSPLKITIPALFLNTYLTPPQIEEVGNYLDETEETRELYLANPFHTWGRDKISGSILAALSFLGLGFAFRGFSERSPEEKNNLLIFVLATLGIGITLIFLLPWQRYVVAILPFAISWIGSGLVPIFKVGKKT